MIRADATPGAYGFDPGLRCHLCIIYIVVVIAELDDGEIGGKAPCRGVIPHHPLPPHLRRVAGVHSCVAVGTPLGTRLRIFHAHHPVDFVHRRAEGLDEGRVVRLDGGVIVEADDVAIREELGSGGDAGQAPVFVRIGGVHARRVASGVFAGRRLGSADRSRNIGAVAGGFIGRGRDARGREEREDEDDARVSASPRARSGPDRVEHRRSTRRDTPRLRRKCLSSRSAPWPQSSSRGRSTDSTRPTLTVYLGSVHPITG